MIRGVLVAVGVAATTVGIGLLVVPSAGRGLGFPPLLGAVAAVAVVGGGAVALGRVSTGRDRTDPTVPTGPGGEVPGTGFDRRLASIPAHSDAGADERAAVRERLRPLVVEHLVREQGCSREAAREHVAEGTWTDDPVAAALFTGRDPPLRSQLRALFGGESAFERRVDRVVTRLSEGRDD